MNERLTCVGERAWWGGGASLALGWRMWIVALCCAVLGILLSIRFRAFALLPASAIALALTVLYGVASTWTAWGLVFAAVGNLFVLQISYCVGAILVEHFWEPVRRQPSRVQRPQLDR
jgi:ascorbate-specific PTS system EIIC-type component UlaA